MIARFALSIACVCLLARAEDCPADEYGKSMKNYANLLTDTFKSITERIQKEEFAFLKELNANLTKAFGEAGCKDKWNKNYTKDDRKMGLYELMATLDPKPPTPTIDLMQQLEDMIWLVAKDHVMGGCMLTVTRDYVQSVISECAGKDLFPVDLEGRTDISLPDMSSDKEFRSNVRGVLNLIAWSFMKSMHCGEGEDEIQAALNTVVKATDEDYCFAAGDSFLTDSCYEKFQGGCPKVIECMDNFGTKLQEHAGQLFLKNSDRFKRCLKASRDFWQEQGGKPEGVPGATSLFSKVIKVFTKITKIVFTDEESAASGGYFHAISLSILRPHSCNCEFPVPPEIEEE